MSKDNRNQPKPLVVVFGATGQQGGAVVRALHEQRRFTVRAVTRNASRADRVLLADEVIEADLTRPDSLDAALEGAHGVFLVTNYWEASAVDEVAQGRAAIDVAKRAGVQHFVWSTLPNVEQIAEGHFDVPHFTGKAKVDALVAAAGFPHHTFVEAPFYFQNLTGMMQPQPLGDSRTGWAVPIDPAAEVIHVGDILDFGRVVARAFEAPEQVNGQYLSVAAERTSWNEIAAALNALGHDLSVVHVPPEVYDGFFPGAAEMREMFEYFGQYGYFGPNSDQKLAQARAVHPEPLTSFADWAAEKMPAS